jgi:hypothetical protein
VAQSDEVERIGVKPTKPVQAQVSSAPTTSGDSPVHYRRSVTQDQVLPYTKARFFEFFFAAPDTHNHIQKS